MKRCRHLLLGTLFCAAEVHAAGSSRLDRAAAAPIHQTASINGFQPGSTPPPRLQVSIDTLTAQDTAVTAAAIITDIQIEGGADLPAAEIKTAVAPYLGHRLSTSDLTDLIVTISGVARAHGYLFARSSIAQQSIASGSLRVSLNEGRIDVVRLVGRQDKAVIRVLNDLCGHAPKRAEVERQLTLAQDLPGVSVGQVSYKLEGTTGVLIVPVSFSKLHGSAWADNRESRQLGRVRTQLSVTANELLGTADQLSLSWLTAPLHPRALNTFSARYANDINASGTELALFGSFGRIVYDRLTQPVPSGGQTVSAGISLTQPLIRGRDASAWLTGEFDYFAIDQHYGEVPVGRDHVASLNVAVHGYVPLLAGRLRIGGSFNEGLDILGATRPGDQLASRPDAGGQFTVLSAWLNWTGKLAGPISGKLAVTSQLSTKPLLEIEQISIGGSVYGRAYDFNQFEGDRGVLGSAELQAELWSQDYGYLRSAQFYTYADAGRVSNLRNSLDTGTLYSAGVGTRATIIGGLSFGLEAAFPLGPERVERIDVSPRVSANVAKSF